jgi:signal transduction histidine kinase
MGILGGTADSADFIRSILDHLPVGIAVNFPDPTQQPTYMNDLFPKLYRTTREALDSPAAGLCTFWEAVYEDPATRNTIKARVLEDIESGDPSRMHWERIPITRKGEGTTYISAKNILVPGTSMMISTVWDVTEQVRKEEETRRLEAQLHQVRNMESLGLLAGGVAHDINNVLGAILAVATIHRRKSGAESSLRRDMETITQACLRGGALAKSLLGFARTALHEEAWLDLNDLVRKEICLLERSACPAISIEEDLGEDLRTLKGDPAALRHTIMSLCVNAMEAMPEGGTLRIRTRNDGLDAVLLEVEDSGAGMAPEVLHQALAPFYTTKQSSASAGLGLSIVYGTVRSHRGTLDLQSEPGRGTLVRLRFPTPGSLAATEPDKRPPSGEGTAAGRSILVVDDDPLILQSIPGLLEHLGHSATAVSSGEEALALIDRGFQPDLVILDVNMPGIGGLETLVQLRERTSTLPVLLSTGFSSEPIRKVVRHHPGVHLISKPYTAEDLGRQIQAAVS